MKCKDCKWFDHKIKWADDFAKKAEVDPKMFGLCRKGQPSRNTKQSTDGYEIANWGMWPIVGIDDRCGSFKKKERL